MVQSQRSTAITKSAPGSDLRENCKSFIQPTELSQLASWSSGLVRISSKEVPHSVLHKFTDHVLPGFPGYVIRTIALPLNDIQLMTFNFPHMMFNFQIDVSGCFWDYCHGVFRVWYTLLF